jgi:hypothetical protein
LNIDNLSQRFLVAVLVVMVEEEEEEMEATAALRSHLPLPLRWPSPHVWHLSLLSFSSYCNIYQPVLHCGVSYPKNQNEFVPSQT